jgi:hypothetical protein
MADRKPSPDKRAECIALLEALKVPQFGTRRLNPADRAKAKEAANWLNTNPGKQDTENG